MCVLSTQQERSLKWIDPIEWWWREERLTSRESLWIASYRYSLTNDWKKWVWCFLSVRHSGLIPVYQKNSYKGKFFKSYYQGEMLEVHQPCHWAAVRYSWIICIAKFLFYFIFKAIYVCKLTCFTFILSYYKAW